LIKNRIASSLFLILLPLAIMAQGRRPQNLPFYDVAPYNFGFTLGVNRMYFSIDHARRFNSEIFTSGEIPDIPNIREALLNTIETNSHYGFMVGIVSNLKLGKHFDLRFIPNLSFGERDITYNIRATTIDGTQEIFNLRKPVQSTFVEFPLLVKYKSARYNNMRSYIIGGVKYSIDLISDARRQDRTEMAIVRVDKNDVYLELGVGFDFYNEYFKLGTEIKMSYGLFDLLIREGNIYTEGIESLRSKIFSLSFNFE